MVKQKSCTCAVFFLLAVWGAAVIKNWFVFRWLRRVGSTTQRQFLCTSNQKYAGTAPRPPFPWALKTMSRSPRPHELLQEYHSIQKGPINEAVLEQENPSGVKRQRIDEIED